MKQHYLSRKLMLHVLAACLVCFLLQGALFEHLQRKNASFMAINYENLILSRLQNANRLSGDVIMLGSSITERMKSGDGIASIGVPASNFTAAMKFLPAESFPAGSVVVLEGNAMFAGSNQHLLQQTEKWDFKLFGGNRHFSFAAQPANLLLSYVYNRRYKHRDEETNGVMELSQPVTPESMQGVPRLTDERLRDYAHLLRGIQELKARGYRLCIAIHPQLGGNERLRSVTIPTLRALALEADVPLLNYHRPEIISKVRFTDGLHLNRRHISTLMFRNLIARDARQFAR